MEMKNCKIKNFLTVILVLILYLGFIIFKIIFPSQDYSMSERRVLKKLPQIKMEELLSGKYMEKFDDYTLDQFPLRDSLRSVKANISKNILFQKDNHGLYYKQGHLSKIEYPANDEKIERAMNKIREVYDKYISGTKCKTYLSIIPDKNYFLASKNGYLSMDYPKVVDGIKDGLNFAEYIDIAQLLSLDDFYFTDQHWKQECIVDIGETISKKMDIPFENNFLVQTLAPPFYGAYYGQAALNVKPDEIKYLTSDTLNKCKVTSYNTGVAQPSAVYDMNKAKGRDPYEMFLSGSDALLVIDNPECTTGRKLVVFRDSFGSSLIPLMAFGYSQITLVDLRYIQSPLIKNYIDFDDQDVLFLYSTLVLNTSF